jgi:hypothetical protein
VDTQTDTLLYTFHLESTKYKRPTIRIRTIACSNDECGEVQLTAAFGEDRSNVSGIVLTNIIDEYTLRPRSLAKAHRPYIPLVIYEDYAEACLIRTLSPKGAATLVRRCLQGMIRDFCGISKGTLDLEIKALKALLVAHTAPPGVSEESVEAIDHVRGIGNIGAHMEKDIDLIIGVEPEEVDALVDLTEMLFEEWYGNRDRRQLKLALVKQVAAAKKAAKLAPGGGQP